MKKLLRNLLIHLVAIWVTSLAIPGFSVEGGFRTLILGALALMFVNLLVMPLLKIMFLPLNLLTLGFFTWVINVIGLFMVTKIIPQIKLKPYFFEGANFFGFSIPGIEMNVLLVAIFASLFIGFISHFLKWLAK